MSKKKLYEKAIEQWGMDSQTNLLVEECSELITAMQKFNHRGGPCRNVLEEIADVEIMCEVMHVIFDSGTIERFKREKLERLQRLLTGELICL